MQDITNQIHNLLIKNKKTVAIAESCTGGLISSLLTQISGSSAYFILGVVAYSNKAKKGILKISPSEIARYGAVSKIVALSMAEKIKRLSGADFGIGVTGIAGPAGGSPKKPKGTVFIAVADNHKLICRKFIFKGNRAKIRKVAALKTLQLLKTFLI